MNKYDHYHCSPHKKCKPKKCRNNSTRKIGLAMLLLGIVTVFAMFLPVKYWVLLLSLALIVFGIIIFRSH